MEIPKEKKALGKDRRTGTIQSVSIATRFLKILANADEPLPLGALSREAQTGNSSAHRYMQSLVKEGLASQDPVTGFYDLGPTALDLGIGAMRRIDPVDVASRHMKLLAQYHRASGGVVMWTERGPTLVRWYRSAHFSISSLAIGDILPLDNTASGLVFQAFLPPDRIQKARDLQPRHFRGQPPDAQTLEQIRQTGFSELTSHLLQEVTGQAAAVFDAQQEIACVMTTVNDMRQPGRQEDGEALAKAAAEANRETGGTWRRR
ncbi:IclR family transcriptional regulator [Rhizobium sp. L1K21]|uniref:IclR family transcriptional regulator n=1 Tax=Rhizobium sp. L1K21 TaxID=2954933 RepID=UPI0020920609|nr:IclR family transcriptional regulator [Rhizobium sp. L1K21]MCO6187564.1 IclR family transcriptional regulator [Rhizobium sp. L1K21]